MTTRLINLTCLAISFVAFVLNLTANSSDKWWISNNRQEFENIGLWQICFNHYRHRFDFYGKIYQGCWWVFSPEIYKIFGWISQPWFRAVQAFCTLSMVSMLFALIMTAALAFSRELGKVSSRYILSTGILTLTSALFMAIAVITFAVRGKDRDWMPRWQQNWYGWSYPVAVSSCVLQVISGSVLLFEGINMKLVKHYMEKMYIQRKRLFPPAPR